MAKNKIYVWLLVLLIACLSMSLYIGYALTNLNVEVSVNESDADNSIMLDKLDAIILLLNVTDPVANGEYVLTLGDYEDEVTDAEALELAIESVESRDFEKAVYDLLVDESVSIESYRDITEIKILKSEVDGDEVEFEIKVYYFIDGDEDETFKARLEDFSVTIDDLDFDEDFEDAEVDDSYMESLEVLRFYD